MEDFERGLGLTGGVNIRDFGGYTTTDGRKVKRGMLFRSGTMHRLTPEDCERLSSLRIAAVCDFRRLDERSAQPTQWHVGSETEYISRDYAEMSGVLQAKVLFGMNATDARAAMVQVYRDIPDDHAASYKAMFERLVAGRLPLVINCAAGKDRTGVAAALILSGLGVPRERVLEDYLLTNVHLDRTALVENKDPSAIQWSDASPEALEQIFAADAHYLEAMFSELDSRHGGIESYLAQLGVDKTAQAALRDHLTH